MVGQTLCTPPLPGAEQKGCREHRGRVGGEEGEAVHDGDQEGWRQRQRRDWEDRQDQVGKEMGV